MKLKKAEFMKNANPDLEFFEAIIKGDLAKTLRLLTYFFIISILY